MMRSAGEDEIQLTVPEGTRSGRADKMLAGLHPDLSRSRWQKLFQSGRVWADDRVLSQKDKLRAGDSVQFSIPPTQPLDLRPVRMDLDILFEDADILLLNKEAGRVVHPGAGTGEDTLVHGLLYHCSDSLTGIGGTERPGIVHRLDKETSGVIIIAKSETAFQSLSEQFSQREVKKYYKALIAGIPQPPEGTVDEPIGRHPVHRTRMACRADGRQARTDYVVLEAIGAAVALVDLRIHSGRTHQIRVHMKHLGHPLLGDAVYGYKPARVPGAVEAPLPGIPRVMLHAARLEFRHPVSGEAQVIEAPLPEDFNALVDALRARF